MEGRSSLRGGDAISQLMLIWFAAGKDALLPAAKTRLGKPCWVENDTQHDIHKIHVVTLIFFCCVHIHIASSRRPCSIHRNIMSFTGTLVVVSEESWGQRILMGIWLNVEFHSFLLLRGRETFDDC
ncbi:unnamed protein product [Ectocarpus sp. 12 AP-2014]